MRLCAVIILLPLLIGAIDCTGQELYEVVTGSNDEITGEIDSILFRMPIRGTKSNAVVKAGITEDTTFGFLCVEIDDKAMSIPPDILIQFPNPQLRSLTFWHSYPSKNDNENSKSFRFYFGEQGKKHKFRTGIDDGHEGLYFFAVIQLVGARITTAQIYSSEELISEFSVDRETAMECPMDSPSRRSGPAQDSSDELASRPL